MLHTWLNTWYQSLSWWFEDPYLFSILLFASGAMLGSLANVLIYRLPIMRWYPEELQERPFNLFLPRSRCPQCRQSLRWYHNIPLFSWVCLRGRCAFCKTKIPGRYPSVELTVALLGVLGGRLTDSPGAAFCLLFFGFFFIVAALIYVDRGRLAIDLCWLAVLSAMGALVFHAMHHLTA